jgi:flavin reductase (DIM6/NTAB) family NADH-FMN oxidoreductase RutF
VTTVPQPSSKPVSGPVSGQPDPKALRKALGAFATGVTVVTVGGATPHGMTANSFTSVSLAPPLILVCVGRDADMHRILGTTGHFGVSVLSGRQEGVARHFASTWRGLGAAEFDTVDWAPGPLTQVPLINGALASFECELWRSYDGGDHTIFLGRLLSMERQADDDALLFFGGRFRHLDPDRREIRA